MTLSAITFSGCGDKDNQETESKASVSESTDDEAATAATSIAEERTLSTFFMGITSFLYYQLDTLTKL